MKSLLTALALVAALAPASVGASTDTRNPFDPSGSRVGPRPAVNLSRPIVRHDAMPTGPVAPMLPMVLPPPLPSPPSPALPPKEARMVPAEAPTGRKKAKESTMAMTAAGCKLKAKSESVAAPAYGGIVVIALEGGSRDCVSAVMVEESWLEAKEISDASSIRLAVDANETSSPRQSNIIIANAGRSVTVTLVQEGRMPRAR